VAIFLDEVMELVHDHELDGEDRKGWVQVPAGNAWRLSRRVYIQRPREGCPVREIHLSGFYVEHDGIAQLSREEAARRHLGRVEGIISAREQGDDLVLDALDVALQHVSRVPMPTPPGRVRRLVRQLGSRAAVPGPELPQVEPQALVDWMTTRLGYGERAARGWFIGMEEACEDAMELPARIAGGALEDLEAALTRIGRYADLLAASPSLQSTWAPLIRAWLVASSMAESPSTSDVRQYQRHRWGRAGMTPAGETLLVELLPLPSPSIQDWPYEGLGVGTRREYQRRCLPQRIEMLARLWQESSTKPRVAVAYGKSYWKHYRKVFGLSEQDGEAIITGEPTWAQGYAVADGGVVLVRHPVAFGNSNARWETLGRWLRARLAATT
jgi:hypothetical protein